MRGIKHSKIIYLLIIVFGVFLYNTPNVYADKITCNYKTSKSDINIALNSGAEGNDEFSTEKVYFLDSSGNRKSSALLYFANESNIKQLVKEQKLSGKGMCPNYVFYVKCNTQSGKSNAVYQYDIYAYYQKTTANKRYKQVKYCKQGGMAVLKKSLIIGLKGTSNYEKQGGDVDHSKQDSIHNENSQADANNTNNFKSGSNDEKKKIKDTSSNLVGKSTEKMTCTELMGGNDEKSTMWLIQRIFDYIKVLGPILVIILSSIDFTKTVLSGDEESMKKSQKNLFVRLLCAAGIYLLPTIITILINLVLNVDDPLCGIK